MLEGGDMNFPISRSSLVRSYFVTVLTVLSISAWIFIFAAIAPAQEKLAPPTGLRIVAKPVVNPKNVGNSAAKTHLLRHAGPFYEMPVTITEEASASMPVIRSCGQDTVLIIDAFDKTLYSATFFVNSIKMGSPYLFQRCRFAADKWSGGANISPKSCSIGVVVDSGSQEDYDYEVYLITIHNGAILFPEGIQFYPKVQNSGGISCQEPRIWFSPDDTVAMIIAAADEIWKPDGKNSLAHFVDLASGQTIDKIFFQWPRAAASKTPYAADLEMLNHKRRIVFRVEKKTIARMAVP